MNNEQCMFFGGFVGVEFLHGGDFGFPTAGGFALHGLRCFRGWSIFIHFSCFEILPNVLARKRALPQARTHEYSKLAWVCNICALSACMLTACHLPAKSRPNSLTNIFRKNRSQMQHSVKQSNTKRLKAARPS